MSYPISYPVPYLSIKHSAWAAGVWRCGSGCRTQQDGRSFRAATVPDSLPYPLHAHIKAALAAAQWDRMRAEQERAQLQGCTFAPQLTARAIQADYKPLPQRVRELQRLKR